MDNDTQQHTKVYDVLSGSKVPYVHDALLVRIYPSPAWLRLSLN
jgi:hypothetical protein